MANVKITGLTALAEAPNGADLVEIVDDVAGTPTSKKITIANLMANTVSSYNDTGVTLTNTTTENTISVDQNGNVGTDVTIDGAVHIENTGNTGIALGVYSNIGATADAPLVHVKADNTAFDQPALVVENDNSTGVAIRIGSGGETPRLQFGDGFNIYGNNGDLRLHSLFGGKNIQIFDSGLTVVKIGFDIDNSRIDLSQAAGTVFVLPADATDPTTGGGAATGRIPVTIGGATRYIAYY